ncbi:hypothetical protein SETIT_4G005400v2 [Setaria italica]|uniref:Uncharacterized protein n=1 Tax=Setaria italica TaxID=4555 RepID=A0A368QPA0_SETIT|nr:hypothetical protein SETIT_4G005400v2 [Setaria italica]
MLVLRPSWPWQLPRWPCRWRTGRRRLGNGFPPPATERVLHLSPARPSQLAPTCQCLEPPAVPPEQLNSALVSPPINRSPPACRPPPQARWRSSPAYLHADEGGLGVSLPPPWPARRHLPRTIPIRCCFLNLLRLASLVPCTTTCSMHHPFIPLPSWKHAPSLKNRWSSFDVLHPKGSRKLVCGNDKDRHIPFTSST